MEVGNNLSIPLSLNILMLVQELLTKMNAPTMSMMPKDNKFLLLPFKLDHSLTFMASNACDCDICEKCNIPHQSYQIFSAFPHTWTALIRRPK